MNGLFVQLSKDVYMVPRTDREGYKDYNPVEGGPDYEIYSNGEKYVFACRGTDFGKSRDIKADILVVLSQIKKSARYKRLKSHLQNLVNKVGKNKIKLTGHSLGARIATELSREFDIPATVYNMGSSPLDIPKNLYTKVKCKFNKNLEPQNFIRDLLDDVLEIQIKFIDEVLKEGLC